MAGFNSLESCSNGQMVMIELSKIFHDPPLWLSKCVQSCAINAHYNRAISEKMSKVYSIKSSWTGFIAKGTCSRGQMVMVEQKKRFNPTPST